MHINYRDISWWYWFGSLMLLIVGISNNSNSLGLVIGFSSIQVIHYLIKTQLLMAFEVQLRLSFLCLMIMAQLPLLSWIYALAIVGLTPQLLYSYCPLSRLIMLFPWNRKTPLSLTFIK